MALDISNELKRKLRSKFIVLDGPDGSGKSTQQRMLAECLESAGLSTLTIRDPGTSAAGEAIRHIILSGDYGKLAPECELMLFMAARAQMVQESIRPALADSKVVICDRFISASVAYQGALGLDAKNIIDVGDFAVRSTWPDLTIVVDVDVETSLARIKKLNGEDGLDALERRSRDYHQKVRDLFLELTGKIAYPGAVRVVDATRTIEQVHLDILSVLSDADF